MNKTPKKYHAFTAAVGAALLAPALWSAARNPAYAGPPASPAKAAATVSADTISTDKIKDLTAALVVNNDETNFDELKKIGGAFATTYRAKRMDIGYKYPNKVRFEGKVLGASLLMVFNGDTKMFKVPFHNETQNVHGKAGQKQSLLDLGLFTKDYLSTDWKPTFVKKVGGLLLFDLTQRDSTNKSHELVWVNPRTAIIEKRQTFNGDNKLQKELRYTKAQQIRPGIWVPTRIEIYNQFGKLGAVQDVQDIKVNLGIADDRFSTS